MIGLLKNVWNMLYVYTSSCGMQFLVKKFLPTATAPASDRAGVQVGETTLGIDPYAATAHPGAKLGHLGCRHTRNDDIHGGAALV